MNLIEKRSKLILLLMKRKLAASLKDVRLRRNLLKDNLTYNELLSELRKTSDDSIGLNKLVEMINSTSNKDLLKSIELFTRIRPYLVSQ